MNKSFLVIIMSSAFALAGCSSSGDSSNANPVNPSIPDIDNSPEWGLDLDMGNTPDWGLTDPDFGLAPPSIPDRLPPVWGGPEMPEVDNGPEAGYTVSGSTITDASGNIFTITDVNWVNQAMTVEDKDGNEYLVDVIRQGKYDGDFRLFVNGQPIVIGRDTVQGGLRPMMENTERSIDRNTIRNSIRTRLN